MTREHVLLAVAFSPTSGLLGSSDSLLLYVSGIRHNLATGESNGFAQLQQLCAHLGFAATHCRCGIGGRSGEGPSRLVCWWGTARDLLTWTPRATAATCCPTPRTRPRVCGTCARCAHLLCMNQQHLPSSHLVQDKMEAWRASEPLEWKAQIVRSKRNGMHVISHIVIL